MAESKRWWARREGAPLPTLRFYCKSTFRRDGGSVKAQLDVRDTTFGDYRTKKE